jgi:hypothetical protein
MSNCGTCSKPFGFFNRELGCIKCNRVYCKKCLCYKLTDTENPKKPVNVCLRCFKISSDSSLMPADKSIKNVEELLEIKPEEVVPIQAALLEPISSSTIDMRKRLDVLKSDDEKDVSNEEEDNIDDMHRRLANLKGVNYKPTSNNKMLFASDVRSDQEKINDLLREVYDVNTLDGKHKNTTGELPGSVDDIERRLAALRGVDLSKIKSQTGEEEQPRDETEQEEINRTVLQYIEEAKLPDFEADPNEQELINSIPLPPNSDKKDLEELPFCEICNEDAVLRCSECENLFCHACFLEFHDEEDYKSHKIKPYEAPNKSS